MIIERSRTARLGRAQRSPNAVRCTWSKKCGASLAAGNFPVDPAVFRWGQSWPWMSRPASRSSSSVAIVGLALVRRSSLTLSLGPRVVLFVGCGGKAQRPTNRTGIRGWVSRPPSSRLTVQTLPPPTRWASAYAGVGDLTATGGLAPELLHRLVDHGQTRRPGRVAAGEEPAVGVERDAPARAGLTFGHHLLGLALGAEPEQLVVLELLVDEGVVAVGDAHVLGPDARPPRSTPGRCRASWSTARRPARRRRGPARTSPTGAPTRSDGRSAVPAAAAARCPRGR